MKTIIVKAWDDGSPWDGLVFSPHKPWPFVRLFPAFPAQSMPDKRTFPRPKSDPHVTSARRPDVSEIVRKKKVNL